MKTAAPIHANEGVIAAYRKQLLAIVTEINDEVKQFGVLYEQSKPVEIASDSFGAQLLIDAIKAMTDKWNKRLSAVAHNIASAHVTKSRIATDMAVKASLKNDGFMIDVSYSKGVTDIVDTAIAANTQLIKTIPQQYLSQVEQAILSNYRKGADTDAMMKEIAKIYPKNQARAKLIAIDQTLKLNSEVSRARMLENGITQAKWMHSSGGKEPRPDHVAANGKVFDLEQGCLISGEYIQPGFLINCKCSCRPILPI